MCQRGRGLGPAKSGARGGGPWGGVWGCSRGRRQHWHKALGREALTGGEAREQTAHSSSTSPLFLSWQRGFTAQETQPSICSEYPVYLLTP